MRVKDYKCKCGHNDFFFADKGNQKGIYCSYCGKWYKWADKDEQNLTLKQEPILEKIRAEIEQAADKQFQIAMGIADLNERYTHIQMENAYRHCLNVIDKYRGEADCRECKAEHDCYECKKYEEREVEE